MPVTLNQGRCMGCHSVSADGSTLVATVEDPSAPSVAPYRHPGGVRAWASFALPNGTLSLQTNKHGANSALTPNGKYLVFGGPSNTVVPGSKYISLATTATGDVIPTSGLDDLVPEAGMNVLMPSFSIDGTKLALVEGKVGLPADNVLPEPSNRIIYIDFDAAVPKFNPTITRSRGSARSRRTTTSSATLPSPLIRSGSPTTRVSIRPAAIRVTASIPPSTAVIFGSARSAAERPFVWRNRRTPGHQRSLHAARADLLSGEARRLSWVVFTSMRDWGNSLVAPVTKASAGSGLPPSTKRLARSIRVTPPST